MVKPGDNPSSLTPDDYMIITYVIAVIYAYFEKFKAEYSSSPQKFFDNSLDISMNERNALFIFLDVINSEPDKLFKPKKFREQINNYLNTSAFGDIDNVIMELEDEMNTPRRVTNKDVNKALRSLEKEIDLKNIQGKKEIKKLKGIHEKVKLLGKPSVDRLGTSSIQIKKTLNKEMALQFISKSLRNLGIVDSLSLLFEGSFITVSGDKKGKLYDLIKMMDFHFGSPEQRINRTDWEEHRETVIDIFIQNIKFISKLMAEVLVEGSLFLPILLSIAVQKKS